MERETSDEDPGPGHGEASDRHLDLAGLAIRVLTMDLELDSSAQWHFGRLPPTIPNQTIPNPALPDPAIAVSLQKSSASAAPPAASDAYRIARMRLDPQGDRLRIHHDEGAWADIGPDTIRLHFHGPEQLHWLCARQLLFMALSWSLSFHQRAIIHGALLARDERSLLVLGGTGQGKSTMAVAALCRGWDVHADDMVIAHVVDGDCRLWGVPKRLSAPSASIEALLEASPGGLQRHDLQPVPGDPRERVFLPLSLLAHHRTTPSSIAIVGHHRGLGVIRPLTSRDTQEAVLEAAGMAEHPDALRRIFPAVARVGTLPGVRTLHAADPSRRIDVANGFLSQLLDPEG